jgi:hypothetical protein
MMMLAKGMKLGKVNTLTSALIAQLAKSAGPGRHVDLSLAGWSHMGHVPGTLCTLIEFPLGGGLSYYPHLGDEDAEVKQPAWCTVMKRWD